MEATKTCELTHKLVDEKIIRHEKWLGEHEQKLDKLDRSDATNTNEIKNLCGQLSSQTKAIWGLVSMVAAALLGFFFYAIQTKILK